MSFGVVLVEPQGMMNIAHVVRAMMNFGVEHLRLVAPAEFDTHRISGIAHQSHHVVKQARIFDSLAEALADAHHIVGFTARQRREKRNARHACDAVREAMPLEDGSTVLYVFGREDRGLDNQALDRCHRLATIPTSPEYTSMNLSHAVMLALYERWQARGAPAPLKPARRASPPAPAALLESVFAETLATLRAIDFFKTKNEEKIMRSLREMGHRVPLDEREANLLRALAYEVRHFLARVRP